MRGGSPRRARTSSTPSARRPRALQTRVLRASQTRVSSQLSTRGAILNYMVQYQAELDGVFAALADPTRRSILERLGRGSATVGELAEPFGMSLTGLKKHVKVL